MEYFDLDLLPIRARCKERGDVNHVRQPIRDFDPFSLRVELPRAVALLARKAAIQGGTSYVHCTAGAPPLACARPGPWPGLPHCAALPFRPCPWPGLPHCAVLPCRPCPWPGLPHCAVLPCRLRRRALLAAWWT